MLPTDINCEVQYTINDDRFHIRISNWCESQEVAATFHVDQLDASDHWIKQTVKPALDAAVKALRSTQTKNRAGAH